MKKKLAIVALVVLGVISTSYAKQEAFVEFEDARSEERQVQKDEAAVRAPAQATEQKASADEQTARELRMELWLNRAGKF